jgi:hypothetical protein
MAMNQKFRTRSNLIESKYTKEGEKMSMVDLKDSTKTHIDLNDMDRDEFMKNMDEKRYQEAGVNIEEIFYPLVF